MGVQEFEHFRETGALYVDKTEYVWRMVSANAVNFFLSRPPRFGKTLLVSTLEAYFEGRRELFEGLAISRHEKEWKQHPVVRLNLSRGKYYELDRMHGTVNSILRDHEQRWNVTPEDKYNYDERLTNIIHEAYRQTGQKVVILIDEYDAPMLDSIKSPELQDQIRDRIRNLFSPLKAEEKYLRFVFLTGISKFSQLSVFSELNNLQVLTLRPEYEGVCGITQEELETQMRPDVESLATRMTGRRAKWGEHYDYGSMLSLLKKKYDGYHFSEDMTGVYNPWSLIYAFNEGDVGNYWFGTGTPSSLIDLLRTRQLYLPELEDYRCDLDEFDAPTERISDPVPVLFQSGYLTLKAFDGYSKRFTLGFPNEEVYTGFAGSLYKYHMEDGGWRPRNMLYDAYYNFKRKQRALDDFLEAIRTFFAAMPYSVSDKNRNEQFYQANLYTLLVAIGAHVHVEQQTATGRMDISMLMDDAIYILELKYTRKARTRGKKVADKALSQIKEKNYAVAFAADPRPVYAIGLNFTSNSHTLDDWTIEKLKG